MMKEHRFAPRSWNFPSVLELQFELMSVSGAGSQCANKQSGNFAWKPPSFHASGSSAAWREAQICGATTPSNIQQISISRGPWIPHQPSATTQHSSGGPPGTQSQKEVACRSTQTAHTGGSCTPAGLQLTAVQRSAAQRCSPPLLHCLPSISPSASLSPLAHPPPPLRFHLSLSPSSGSCHLFQLNPDK